MRGIILSFSFTLVTHTVRLSLVPKRTQKNSRSKLARELVDIMREANQEVPYPDSLAGIGGGNGATTTSAWQLSCVGFKCLTSNEAAIRWEQIGQRTFLPFFLKPQDFHSLFQMM